MADPRGKVACPKLIDRNNRLQSKKKGFFDALGNLGKLEALNDLGYGDVRKGFVNLAAVSNQLRGTKSVVPGNEGELVNDSLYQKITNTAVESVDKGATIILDATGIGRVALDAVNNINAPVANRALGASKQLFQRVKQGNFSISDAAEFAQDLGSLANMARNIFPGGDKAANQNGLGRFKCQPSPYALDLIQRAPRFKFMYIVEIKFAPDYAKYNGIAAGMAFITKSSTRPQVDFEYEEMNMYNFRTQVPKRTVYQPMTMRFIDDQTGTTTRFYELYLKSMSPIANLEMSNIAGLVGMYEDESMRFENNQPIEFAERLPISDTSFLSRDNKQPSKDLLEQFDDAVEGAKLAAQGVVDVAKNPKGALLAKYQAGNAELADRISSGIAKTNTQSVKAYSASLGALNGINKSMLESITLYHIGNYGDSITSYMMYNPKITSLQPDEVNMADNGDGSELSFEFTYDSLYVEANQKMDDFGLERLFDLSGGNAGATYPLMPIGTGERTSAGTASTETAAVSSAKTPGTASKAKAAVSDAVLTALPDKLEATIIPGSDAVDPAGAWRFRNTPSTSGNTFNEVERTI